MNKQEILKSHVFDLIYSDDHGVVANTQEEKINFLYNTFTSEYNHKINSLGTLKALEEWICGIPTAFKTFIYNGEVLEFLKENNLLNSKVDECESIDNYWRDVAKTIRSLFREFRVETPEDPRIIIANGRIKENLLYLPPVQLDRKTYQKVANVLNMIGGKWVGGKTKAFKFDKNPSALIKKYLEGEDVNFKKKFQYFATPQPLAEKIVSMADLKPSDKVLEPSAGQGAIIKEINKLGVIPSYFEIMDLNLEAINNDSSIKGEFLGKDFLKGDTNNQFDKIIANPPFSKNQDIKHIMKMYDSLKKNGALVSIASKHWTFANDKESVKFRQFVEENGHYETVDSGAFKESGTNIETTIVVLTK